MTDHSVIKVAVCVLLLLSKIQQSTDALHSVEHAISEQSPAVTTVQSVPVICFVLLHDVFSSPCSMTMNE